MSLPFSVTVTTRPDAVIAAFQGMATVATAENFQDEVNRLAMLKAKLIILDLSALQFMSSFAIGSFLKLANDAQVGGGAVRIASPSEYISSLLQATRVDQKLKVFPTIESAIVG